MSADELRIELRKDADRLAEIVGQQVRSAPSDGRLEIVVPKSDPSFWHGAQPVIIRMLVMADRPLAIPASYQLFISVYRPNDPEEDETITKSMRAVESVLKSSRCKSWDFYLNRFSMVG